MSLQFQPKCERIFYTVLLFFNNFAYGVGINLLGASLVDLSFIYGTSIDTISYLNVCLGIGYLLGSFANYLYRWLNRQLTLGVLVLMFAVFLGGLPFYKHLYLAFAIVGVGSLGAGAWDSAQSLWLVEIWPAKNTAILIGLQLMYGIGAIAAPLLASPFVYGQMNVTSEGRILTVEDRIHSLTLPFMLMAAMLAVVPVLLLIMYFLSPFAKQQGVLENTKAPNVKNAIKRDPSTISNRTAKLALVAASLAIYISSEYNFLSFSASMYQYLAIQLTASEAARLQSVLSGTFTLGRLLAALVSLRLRIDSILIYHYAIQVIAIATLYFGRHNLTVIYVGTAALGIGFSCIWPGMFAWTEQNLVLTDRICSLFVCLSGTTGLITPLVLSQTFKRHPLILMQLTGAYILLSFSLFLLAKMWISSQPNVKSAKK